MPVFLDIKKGDFFNKRTFKNFRIKSLLITNTKFTNKNIKYSKCVGVELLGWNYPRNEGLEHLIDSQRLYPITILPSLNRHLAEIFASKKIMLVQNLLGIDVSKFVKKTGLSKKLLEQLIKETKVLLK